MSQILADTGITCASDQLPTAGKTTTNGHGGEHPVRTITTRLLKSQKSTTSADEVAKLVGALRN